jgi:tetratricopeptide (TPR) repeat protein
VTGRIRAFGWLAAVAALVFVMPTAARASQFLSEEINSALSKRDAFLKQLGMPAGMLPSDGPWTQKSGRDGGFRERLEAAGNVGGPWHRYISGVASDDSSARERFFSGAVKAAAADPGTLWLLALEFIRGGHISFADECFEDIEGCVLAVGGSSVPLLAQQLILFGNTLAESDPNTAEYCYAKAARFDDSQCWWVYRKGAIDFPDNVINTIPSFVTEAFSILGTSWHAQVTLISHLYRFFAAAIFIFACILFAVFAVKYLPHGVHPLGDTLFVGASPLVRTAASVIIVLAVLLIGVVPTLWVIAFLVCRFMNANEKKLLILACAILTISPLSFLADSFLSRSLRQDSPAFLLERSIREGYSVDLFNLAKENLSKRPGNYATGLTLAVCATKSENYGANSDAVNKALDLAPDDPLTLMYAGNHAYLTGDIEGMKQYYGAVLKSNPMSAEAKFNLAQAFADDGGFTTPDMIGEAAKINASLIGRYMRVNSRHFQDDVPPLRQIIQPTLTPMYFWSRLFMADPAELLQFNKNKTYFGLSPLTAFGASAVLMLVFLCLYTVLWKYESKVKTYFTCRICGRVLCRRCRKGTICSVCYKKSIDSQNNAAAMYNLQKIYQNKAILRKDFTKFALGILIPGADTLYKGEAVIKPLITVLITSVIFAACYCAVTFRPYYPSAAVFNPIYCVPVLLLYNVVAFFKQCFGFAATMKSRTKMSINTK